MTFTCLNQVNLIDGSSLGLKNMVDSYIWNTVIYKVIIMHIRREKILLHGNLSYKMTLSFLREDVCLIA